MANSKQSEILRKIIKIHEDFKTANEFIIDSILFGEKILDGPINKNDREYIKNSNNELRQQLEHLKANMTTELEKLKQQ